MVKITSELIQRSSQYINAIKEFHLDLRGYKISAIENLSATNDQFGCIDLSDNSISKIDSFPKLNRLRSLMLINNRISSIEKDFAINCPNLENIILTNNKISKISEIDNLATCTSLIRLSLVDNVITKLKYYRLYVIYKMPNLRILDFEKIKKSEKISAMNLFNNEEGQKLISQLKEDKYSNDDNEFIKAVDKIQKDEQINQAISNMILNINNYDELIKAENKIKSGEMFQQFQNNINSNINNNNNLNINNNNNNNLNNSEEKNKDNTNNIYK